MFEVLKDRVSVPLGAGATELFSGEVHYYDKLGVTVRAPAGSGLTNVSGYWSDDGAGGMWSPADATITVGAGLAQGVTIRFPLKDLCASRFKLTATGTEGHEVVFSLCGARRAFG